MQSLALTPMGEGNFIIVLNAAIRKGIGKIHQASVKLLIEEDKDGVKIATDLVECLREVSEGEIYFQQLPQSRKNWYYNWVKAAKTNATITKRTAAIVQACEYKLTFTEMIQKYRISKSPIR